MSRRETDRQTKHVTPGSGGGFRRSGYRAEAVNAERNGVGGPAHVHTSAGRKQMVSRITWPRKEIYKKFAFSLLYSHYRQSTAPSAPARQARGTAVGSRRVDAPPVVFEATPHGPHQAAPHLAVSVTHARPRVPHASCHHHHLSPSSLSFFALRAFLSSRAISYADSSSVGVAAAGEAALRDRLLPGRVPELDEAAAAEDSLRARRSARRCRSSVCSFALRVSFSSSSSSYSSFSLLRFADALPVTTPAS